MLKDSYPLFRDPAEDGYPVSRDSIYRYWDDLCRAVELQIRSERPGEPYLRLTNEVVLDKGKGKTERRFVSRFDIHTLRVSGITALIEAGLPPDSVASVAGHTTIVMTMYYNKTSASALNMRLAAAVERMRQTIDDVDHLSSEDFESVTAYLINQRKVEDQRGLQMLRERSGYGDGSFAIMAHGICPGGECATGGEWVNQSVGHAAVPRPLACSLCRYRLTGPMFLPGLIANTNKLLYELRRCGEEIAALNNEAQALSAAGKPVHHLKAQIASLGKLTDIVIEEWAGEYGYARRAEAMLHDYMTARPQVGGTDFLPMLTTLDPKDVEVRLERKSGFALLQQLTDSVQSCPGFRPEQALRDHREFLNEILCASDIEPFLLRLDGQMRDVAANLLGRAVTAAVPDGDIADLKHSRRLKDYPIILETIERIDLLVSEALVHVNEPQFGTSAALLDGCDVSDV